jgi:hypothetical protein
MFSEEREQKLKERLLAAFELARTAKLKPKVAEAQKSKSWFSGLIDHKVELVCALVNYVNCRWRIIHRYSFRISQYGILIMYLQMYFPI